MAQGRTRETEIPNLAEVFERINTQDKLLARLTTVVEGYGAVISEIKQTLDGLATAVRTQSAREPMGFLQMMGGAALVLGVGGSLAGLIIVFVSSVYDGRLAANDQRMQKMESSIFARDAEDRAELIRLREAESAAATERLKALERQAGWAPVTQ